MKKIILKKNKGIALVSDKDFKNLNKFVWSLDKDGYASRHDWSGPKIRLIFMHRLIMGEPKGIEVDHKNHQQLDNQRSNLRLATHQQNCFNRQKGKNTSSIYKGVSWKAKDKKWWSKIKKNGKCFSLGYFHNQRWAAMAYDITAKDLFGSFAKLNFPNALFG